MIDSTPAKKTISSTGTSALENVAERHGLVVGGGVQSRLVRLNHALEAHGRGLRAVLLELRVALQEAAEGGTRPGAARPRGPARPRGRRRRARNRDATLGPPHVAGEHQLADLPDVVRELLLVQRVQADRDVVREAAHHVVQTLDRRSRAQLVARGRRELEQHSQTALQDLHNRVINLHIMYRTCFIRVIST